MSQEGDKKVYLNAMVQMATELVHSDKPSYAGHSEAHGLKVTAQKVYINREKTRVIITIDVSHPVDRQK